MTSKHYEENKRWRKKHPEAWKQQKALYYARNAIYNWNTGTRWLSSEKVQILDPKRPCDRVLAQQLGRSVKAIQEKRTRVTAKHKEIFLL